MNKKGISIVLALCMVLSCLSIGNFNVFAITTDSAVSQADESTNKSSANAYGLVDDVQQGQILQCWNWSYNGIKSNMKKIAEQGFSAIQTSPIQTIKETTQNRTFSGSWWVYYQPSNFNIDSSSQNALGTKSDFKSMCDEAHKYGIKVIVDAVLNHMANNGDNTLSQTIPDDIRNDSSCWHSITTNTSNWNSRWDITHNCMDGLPDLNTGNSKIQNYEKVFMKECIDAGADGFRFDGAKHIELPNDQENSSSNFWTEILNTTTSYAKSTRGITPYYYGEILDKTGGGQSIVNGYTSLMSVTANKVSDDIRNQVNSGNANGAKRSDFRYEDGSQPAGNKTVLWNESHDTYANGASRGQSDSVLNKTWAIVGTRAEACGMYLARPANYSQNIGTASVTAWANKEVQAVNQFKNYFAGQTEYLSSSGSIVYNERGTSGVVLVNCSGSNQDVSVPANKMKDGTYKDQVTGNTFTVSGGQIKGQIGSTGIAVVYNAVVTPSASITPGSQNYKTDTLTLKLQYSNATGGQYSIDGGAYQSYTNGQTITIGSGLPYGAVTTVKVKASDGTTTSSEDTYTYTKVDPSQTTTVYFDNSSYNWSTVYVYIYTGEGEQKNAAWPGVQMQKDSATGYYCYEVSEELQNGYAIFTESKDASTNRYPADGETGLSIGGSSKIFKANHTWSDYTQTPTTTPPTTPATTEPTTAQPTTTPVGNVLIGDVDLNGDIDIRDATLLQFAIAGLDTLNDNQKLAANTNSDSNISIIDATNIQLYLADMGSSDNNVGKYTGYEYPTQPATTEPTTAETTPSDKTVVYFRNTDNWSSVNVHYWNNNGETTTWPGIQMTLVSGNIYKYEVPNGMTGIIFNNGNGTKTGDLTMPTQQNMIYDYSMDSWSSYNG